MCGRCDSENCNAIVEHQQQQEATAASSKRQQQEAASLPESMMLLFVLTSIRYQGAGIRIIIPTSKSHGPTILVASWSHDQRSECRLVEAGTSRSPPAHPPRPPPASPPSFVRTRRIFTTLTAVRIRYKTCHLSQCPPTCMQSSRPVSYCTKSQSILVLQLIVLEVCYQVDYNIIVKGKPLSGVHIWYKVQASTWNFCMIRSTR